MIIAFSKVCLVELNSSEHSEMLRSLFEHYYLSAKSKQAENVCMKMAVHPMV